jgi:uncharacterized protein (TIGR02677 family)
MAGIARSIELQRADAGAVVNYKRRLIDYLERFIGDLVRRSDSIARLIVALGPRIDPLLQRIAEREARDAAPGDAQDAADAQARHWQAWRERWLGLRGWFLASGSEPPQAELLRARARSAIPQLLGAIAALNERRSGRSDRSADFRLLAGWFAACEDEPQAHRLARAAFALNPARRRCRSIRGCANTAKPPRAARCRRCATAARSALSWRASSPRNRASSKPHGRAWPRGSRCGCPNWASSTRRPSHCCWRCSARR